MVLATEVAGNGRQDIILCHQYGQSLWDATGPMHFVATADFVGDGVDEPSRSHGT